MASYGTVKYGSRGDEVSQLQTMLNQYGYGLAVDGIFGDKTLAAVKQYQQSQGLSVDGIVGGNTWGALTGGGGSSGGSAGGTYSPTGTVGYVTYADQYAGAKPTYTDMYAGTQPTYTDPYAGTQPGYAPSAEYQAALDELSRLEAGKPGAYVSGYQAQIDELLSKIQNREPFQYDFNADPLYQQYKGNYTQMGKQSMMDTMGNAAALTGGYGNSYAATAGNQAYQQHLQQLNSVIPELYNSAHQAYRDQGADIYNQMGLLRGLEGDAYGRYRDDYGDWQNERGYYYGKQGDLYSRDYNEYLTSLNQWNEDRGFDYKQYQDELAQWNTNRNFDYGKYMDEYGMWSADREYAYKAALDNQAQSNWNQEYQLAAQQASAKSGGSGGSKTASAAAKSDMIGDKTMAELEAKVYQIWKNNSGNNDPTKTLSGLSGYTAKQKEYMLALMNTLVGKSGMAESSSVQNEMRKLYGGV